MKSYFGYDKPYLYVYCPVGSEEVLEQTLTPLTEKGVLFCRGGQASKRTAAGGSCPCGDAVRYAGMYPR